MTRNWLVLVGVLFLTACVLAKPDPRLAPTAHAIFEEFHHGDTASIEAQLSPELKTPDVDAKLAQIIQYIPQPEPKSRTTIGENMTVVSGAGVTGVIAEEYDYGDRLAVVRTIVFWPADNSHWRIKGVNFQISSLKDLAVNDFTLKGKSPVQYLVLAMVVLSPILMIAALIKVVRRKGLKRKWLWGILAFVGLFSLRMNWTTGQVAVTWATIQVIGAGITTGIEHLEPWVLTMTVPVGALLILTGVWANPANARAKAKGKGAEKPRPLDLSGGPEEPPPSAP